MVYRSQLMQLQCLFQSPAQQPKPLAPTAPRACRRPPPRRLLSSLPHGPHGMLGKRSYHHHSRAEPDRRSDNPGTTGGPPLHNGRSSSSGNSRGGVTIRKRRPNWIDAPDDSFFLVTRETRRARRLLSRTQLRHACRQPCEQITLRRVTQGLPQGLVLAPPHPHPSLRMRGPIVIHD
ncbi:hypothetical protein OYC64_001826 [Pagothenia borchgrevinki]|uniref:Metastasis-associated protein MTA1 n=1 Tax=Pagothenia borchgrevinki TaxID=8213 RepID=A0ABD2GE67_PAGBO